MLKYTGKLLKKIIRKKSWSRKMTIDIRKYHAKSRGTLREISHQT